MLCSICGVNESMISINLHNNGNKVNVHLCKYCINKFGLDIENVDNLISGIIDLINKNIIRNLGGNNEDIEEFEEEILSFENIIDMIASNKPEKHNDNKPEKQNNMKKNNMLCPHCNTSLEDVIGSQHMGCIHCIDFFGNKIKRKPATFEGRVPKVFRKIYIKEKFKDYLSNKMMIEVVKENFEKASKIRKIISKIVK
ncbi:MAG: hypothetical protein N2712_05220 [Brevinematales bacterium]|nr:hypothetical protein [Brevinematales bacterium]